MATETTRGITTEEKAAMQRVLKSQGYYTDEVDGRWGKNSVSAMAKWQAANGYTIADGLPTYLQMVVLRATKPEVIRKKRGNGLIGLLLNFLPLLFNLLPKVNLGMNPALLALGRINKAWVAAAVSFICANVLLFFFGVNIGPDTQSIVVTVITALVTGVAAWIVPNAAPKPSVALGLLQSSLRNATTDELIDYNLSQWPDTTDDDIPPTPVPYNSAGIPATAFPSTPATDDPDAQNSKG